MKTIYPRDYYNLKIEKLIGKGLIIVLTGQRRVGKSCIMKEFVARYEAYENNNVVYINKELPQYDHIRSHEQLTPFVAEHYREGQRNYLFIDEVQEIAEFERTLRGLQAEGLWEIIVAGSNATMLSGELATVLAGRYAEVHIGSLSYKEFLAFHNLQDSDNALMQYLEWGGMPHLHRLGLDNTDVVEDYLQTLYDTIVVKDIITRERIRNANFLKRLIAFAADNVGQMFSASAICKYMKAERVDVSLGMVMDYMSYFRNAYVINQVQRYDIHGKRLLNMNEKYYFEDLGLRNSLVPTNRMGSMEKLIENAIYLHLKQQGYRISVGQLKTGEIDFVAEKNGTKRYIQATYHLASQDTIDREFGNLLQIPDNYDKLVVSLDPFYRQADHHGVRHLPLRQFLLDE